MLLGHSSPILTKLSRSPYRSLLALIAIAGCAALTAGCSSSSSVTSGPSPVKCQVTLATSTNPVDANGGAGRVSVTAQPECAWTAAAEVDWISELSPASGQGSGEVTFRVAANPLPSTRQGDINVSGERLRVLQAASPCRIEITPRSQVMAAAGGAGSVTITAPTGCSWSATSQDNWLSLTPPASGNSNGTIGFSAAPNTGAERSATVSVAGQTFMVLQASATGVICSYTITPTSQSIADTGGTGTVAVSTSSGCTWTATSNDTWLTITSGANGTGNSQVAFGAAANTGAARTGTLTIAGQTFTVNQAAAPAPACTYTIAPTTSSVADTGGTGTVTVSTASTCNWTATSNDTWLTITAGASGTGNGQVAFSAAANTGAARSGTLTVAGQTFTVNQAAAPAPACTYTIAPTSQSVADTGGAGTVDVTTTSGCAWTATSNDTWLTITAGASGTGSGQVAFSAAANTGAARTGTLTVAGQTFTVNQAAAPTPTCTYTIASTTSQPIADTGGTGTVDVTTTGGCAWTATSNDSWLTITSGASGTGSGQVAFSVAANLTGSPRSGTLTIAGQTFTVDQKKK